jgi:DNA mismatch repair protein MSH2
MTLFCACVAVRLHVALARPCCVPLPAWVVLLQELRDEKEEIEAEVAKLAASAAKDLGLVLDKTIKLEWHKAANSRTRCLRITQKEEKVVRSKLHAR